MIDTDIEAEFQAIMVGVQPTDLPDWMVEDPMYPTPPQHEARHARRYCPWTDVVVPPPTSSLAVQDAALVSMLDLPVTFLKSPTAKHAHDGTALAMIDHAAVEIRAALASRSDRRRRLRDLLGKLEAML